ncbi:hypothetical protein ACFLX9_04515 [Chloroflexota bacterium]
MLENVVRSAGTSLTQEPETFRNELRRRREEGSTAREVAEQELKEAGRRLHEIPREEDRLVHGYSKGLVPDDHMRAKMEALDMER